MFPSYQYVPEALEEDRRVEGPHRFVPAAQFAKENRQIGKPIGRGRGYIDETKLDSVIHIAYRHAPNLEEIPAPEVDSWVAMFGKDDESSDPKVAPRFIPLRSSFKDGFRELIELGGVRMLMQAYGKACGINGERGVLLRTAFLAAIRELVGEGKLSLADFQVATGGGQSYYKILRQRAKFCVCAQGVLEMLGAK